MCKPLIRLKVENTGFPQLHPQRFGQAFTAKKPEDWKVTAPRTTLLTVTELHEKTFEYLAYGGDQTPQRIMHACMR
jgi:hypothetical protein